MYGRHVITYIFNDLCTNFNMSKYKMLYIGILFSRETFLNQESEFKDSEMA